MSLATKSFVIANGNPNDGPQVETNFSDLIAFMNGSMPHSDGTGGAADIRGLTFLKPADNGKKIVFGGPTNINAVDGQGESNTVINFGATFAAAPDVVAIMGTVHPSNPVILRVAAVSTTSFTAAIEKASGTAFAGNATYNIFWIAVG